MWCADLEIGAPSFCADAAADYRKWHLSCLNLGVDTAAALTRRIIDAEPIPDAVSGYLERTRLARVSLLKRSYYY